MTLHVLSYRILALVIVTFLILKITFFIYKNWFIHNEEPVEIILYIQSDYPQKLQLFYTIDSNSSFSPKNTMTKEISQSNSSFLKYRFELPQFELSNLRIDCGDKGSQISIKSITFAKGNFEFSWNYRLIDLHFQKNKSVRSQLKKTSLYLEGIDKDPYIVLKKEKAENLMSDLFILGNSKLILLLPCIASILIFLKFFKIK